MALTVQISPEVEEHLRSQTHDLDGDAKEAMLVEFYRQDRLSRYQLSLALGLGRFETDELLKRHHVTEDLPTQDELEEDLRQARLLVGR